MTDQSKDIDQREGPLASVQQQR